MRHQELTDGLRDRVAPLEMSPEQFRRLGHMLVDQIAEFLGSLPERPVAPPDTRKDLQALLPAGPLPDEGTPAEELLRESADLLFDHSLFNGHPRFWGYITSSAAPIGALGDLLAAAVNPNVGAWALSPAASEIEAQTIRWIAELIGYPATCGGLLVSGGNMANFVGFLAGRRAKLPWDARSEGLCAGGRTLTVYVSEETHTWIQKAADLFGLGLQAIRWIPVDADRQHGRAPAGDTDCTGQGCRRAALPGRRVGRYSGRRRDRSAARDRGRLPGARPLVPCGRGVRRTRSVLPEAPAALRGLALADSIALDPHKWLYSPLEAGCTLVRDVKHLVDAFSFHPELLQFRRL